MHSQYLIVGSSHAALEAAAAIRLIDAEGALTVLTRDARLPYSPTILPYVVSGRSQPDNVVLRDAAYFRDNAIDFVPNAAVVALDCAHNSLRLAAGETWTFDKLLARHRRGAGAAAGAGTERGALSRAALDAGCRRPCATPCSTPNRRSCSAPA